MVSLVCPLHEGDETILLRLIRLLLSLFMLSCQNLNFKWNGKLTPHMNNFNYLKQTPQTNNKQMLPVTSFCENSWVFLMMLF